MQDGPDRSTHVIALFLALITFLIALGFVIVGLALLGVQCLPSLAEDLTNLAYDVHTLISRRLLFRTPGSVSYRS